ncbi:MAG TPA: LuxR C-terminal-related transcriptional regulator [Nitrospiraceae bacterium]|nr:LuxR C-terminal-related transcriptional regulator [Nitrospiraceae bacterium]
MVGQEYSTELSGFAELREGPGILVLTLGGKLQYMNRRSCDFLRIINESACIRTSGSLLPSAVTEICRQIQLRRPESAISDGEHLEIRHVVGVPEQPVLLRGVGLPGQDGDARVLIMMETVARRETSVRHAKERFQLTEREHSIVQRLARGWTNKEIAAELKITEPTVKAHIRHIMDKTKCTTRTGIVAQVLHA